MQQQNQQFDTCPKLVEKLLNLLSSCDPGAANHTNTGGLLIKGSSFHACQGVLRGNV